MQRCIHYCETVGAGTCFLTVAPRNVAAIAMYQRFGFAAIGNEPDYYRDGHARTIMARRWNPSQ